MSDPTTILSFLDFELDRATFSLRRAGVTIALDPKPLELLFLLVQRNGNIVSHDEALAHVWGEGVFIDGESSLYTAVKKIRRALGDPNLVLTVSGRGYRLNFPSKPAASSITNAAQAATKQRLAVLPLANLSLDPDEDYFADGLTEELIATLARSFGSRLGIIARTSVMRFKRSDQAVDSIARQLAVDFLVEGSVRRHNGRARISVSLLRAVDATTLWSDTYERPLTDLFQLQTEIALAVAEAVQTKIPAISVSPIINPEVHDLVLRARHLWVQRTRPTIEQGIALFRQALALDSSFAPAYSGLATCYAILPITSDARPSDCFPVAQQLAEQALALTPLSLEAQPEAQIILGLVQLWYHRNWPLALHHFHQAERLNPSDSNGPMFHAHVHSMLRQHPQALETIRRARELDPFSPILNTHVGHFLYNAGQFTEALMPLNQILTVAPQFWIAHLMHGKATGMNGDNRSAVGSFSKAHTFSSGNTETLAFRAHTLALIGDHTAAQADLTTLTAKRSATYGSAVLTVLAHVGLGNKQEALELLHRAFDEHDVRLTFLAVEERWQPLRDTGHFDTILQRAGLSS
jgi:TolB-like protein/Flp pilus assembly protein TadD